MSGISGNPEQSIKAWASYNGVTPTLNSSLNISSVTKNGTGDYTFNFTNALPDTNYIVLGRTDSATGSTRNGTPDVDVQTYATGSVRVLVHDTSGEAYDYPEVQIQVVR